jgi:hypothetical protein
VDRSGSVARAVGEASRRAVDGDRGVGPVGLAAADQHFGRTEGADGRGDSAHGWNDAGEHKPSG